MGKIRIQVSYPFKEKASKSFRNRINNIGVPCFSTSRESALFYRSAHPTNTEDLLTVLVEISHKRYVSDGSYEEMHCTTYSIKIVENGNE